jgi:peptide/nickel transport system substrate-binding protein
VLPNQRLAAPISTVWVGLLVALLLTVVAGCRGSGAATSEHEPVTLRLGFGLLAGQDAETGIGQTAVNIATEALFSAHQDGRTLPSLAESWSVSKDSLTWRIHLRPTARFHDGTPADAAAIREVLVKRLPEMLGASFEDVDRIRTAGADLEITLRRRSAFLLEALTGIAIQKPGRKDKEKEIIGTGPFRVVSQNGEEVEMAANAEYYGGKPSIDRISLRPYSSVRAAWADMLRGQVDMLYDVGIDALDSLKSSNEVNVFPFQRGYAYMLLLNVRQPRFKDPGLRRELNAAINRDAFIAEALYGHGSPALGPVWSHHWAYGASLPQLGYHPRPTSGAAARQRFSILVGEPSQERLAIVLQRQLQAIGIDPVLELIKGEQVKVRLRDGDFDAVLADFPQGPNLVRPSLFWHTGGPFNFGNYSNKQVDAALDSIDHAVDDAAYKSGVAAFQRAVVDDPPAIFLSWRERARAVSKRFVVPSDPGTDVLATIHQWRLAAPDTTRSGN